MKIKSHYSVNHSRKIRSKKKIKFVIIHYTGMQSEIESIKRLKNPKAKVSCHYFINRKGNVIQMVKDFNIAWHAGKSKWKNFSNLNSNSLGIELVNKGHDYGYQNFSNLQIKSLIKLCKILKKKYTIKKENFLGHSDIAPQRKKDPGEKFPWKELAKSKLSQWHNLDVKKLKQKRLIRLNSIEESNFIINLNKIGYFRISQKNHNLKKKNIIKSFQRHFRQKLINGIPDQECLIISENLLKS